MTASGAAMFGADDLTVNGRAVIGAEAYVLVQALGEPNEVQTLPAGGGRILLYDGAAVRLGLDEATGAETPLTDWQAEGILACDKGALTGQCIRVYARAQGGADDPSLYFDFRPGIDEEPCLQV